MKSTSQTIATFFSKPRIIFIKQNNMRQNMREKRENNRVSKKNVRKSDNYSRIMDVMYTNENFYLDNTIVK